MTNSSPSITPRTAPPSGAGDRGASGASLASKATESVKATTSDLATNVDLNSIGNVAYERAERARQAAVDLAAAQNLDEVGGKLTQTTTEAASMFGSFLGKASKAMVICAVVVAAEHLIRSYIALRNARRMQQEQQ